MLQLVLTKLLGHADFSAFLLIPGMNAGIFFPLCPDSQKNSKGLHVCGLVTSVSELEFMLLLSFSDQTRKGCLKKSGQGGSWRILDWESEAYGRLRLQSALSHFLPVGCFWKNQRPSGSMAWIQGILLQAVFLVLLLLPSSFCES